MNLLQTGEIAPDFSLKNQNNELTELKSYRGKYLILWWYPVADTPGWTIEGKGFRDRIQDYREKNIAILGISADPTGENLRFKEKYDFPFDLLSDTKLTASKEYGVCSSEDTRTPRVSVLIGPDGRILKTFPDVDPTTHAETVLQAISKK